MTKAAKKKNRKLKRQVRKTIGALLMATAITVAAVPVQDVSAVDPTSAPVRVKVVNYKDAGMNDWEDVRTGVSAPDPWKSYVPLVAKDTMIYTTGSGEETGATFQFAYVKGGRGSTGDEIAVILGADVTNLSGGDLEIPPTVNAYRKYTANTSSSGYCAVNRLGDFLYYQTQVQSKDQYGALLYRVPTLKDENTGEPMLVTQYYVHSVIVNGETEWRYPYETIDSEGNQVITDIVAVPVMEEAYVPCYYDQRSNWDDKQDNELYWYDPTIPSVSTASLEATTYRMNSIAATAMPTATPTPTATVVPTPAITIGEPLPAQTPAPAITMEAPAPTTAPAISINGVPAPTAAVEMLFTAPTASPTAEPEPTQEPVSIPDEETDSGEADEMQSETVEGAAPTAMAGSSMESRRGTVSLLHNTAGASPGTQIEVDFNQKQRFVQASDRDHQWIHNADVRYIGRQRLTGTDGEWRIADKDDNKGIGELGVVTNPDLGVFAGKGQIVNLKIDDKLLGIGDYAFYGCTGIQGVTLGNGLNTIGNGAFANCYNMKTCDLQLYSQITAIGMEAFANCRGLQKILMPVNVQAIGDYCFQGCSALSDIELCGKKLDGTRENVALSVIGYKAFANCSSLSSITFPSTFTQTNNPGEGTSYTNAMNGKIPVTCFEGCTALQSIRIQNRTLDIIDGEDGSESGHPGTGSGSAAVPCDITTYLNTVFVKSFYFEGPEISAIHDTAKDHEAAFKYLDENKFEKVVRCPETDRHPATFIVNDQKQLIQMEVDDSCKIIQIPEYIGEYGVSTISANSFQNNCFIEKIYIPASVELIETNAFKGCHRLKDVIFTQPENNNLVIQDNAFNTQDVGFHKTACGGSDMADVPVLTFTGTISASSKPFQYAMNPKNNINVGSQQANTYIEYYSGWPTNLTVKYNWQTGKNELLDYPRYTEINQYTLDSYPYMTQEYVDAAKEAMKAYSDYLSDSRNVPTQNQLDIVNSALNINLPEGIESIAEGIFSGKDRNNEQAYEYNSGGTPGSSTLPVPTPGASGAPDATSLPTTPGQRALSANTDLQSITMHTVETVDPYTFAGCTKLTGFYMAGGDKIDNYAFKNCTSLANVEVASTVTELGLRPFAGCSGLQDVKFGANPNFTCENQIIFGATNGTKTKIIECLEARGETVGSPQVGPEGLEGVTELAEEAFKDCDGIGSVDLTATSISTVPREAFSRTGGIYSVKLPTTTKSIRDGAFWNSKLSYLEIPSSVTLIENDAFANVVEEGGEIKLDEKGRPEVLNVTDGHRPVTFYCTEGDAADTYADAYYYINPTYFKPLIMHEVRFWDYPDYPGRTPALYYETEAVDGEAAVPPEDPEVEGYTFVGWSADYTNVVRDMDLYANYSDNVYTVTFTDSQTGEVLSIQKIGAGRSATAPEPKVHEGFTFDRWSRDYSNVTADIIVSALYIDNSGSASRHKVVFYDNDGTVLDTQMVDHEDKARPPVPPVKEGYTFVRWIPSDYSKVVEDMNIVAYYEPGSGPLASGQPGQPGGSDKPKGSPGPTATPTATPSNEDNVVKYTVSVSGGSGSGQYPAGAIVSINAYYMGEGQLFDRWTSSTAGVGFANPNASSTTFTMPASNVSVTATYKTGSAGSGGGSGSAGGGTGGANNNGNNGTIVEVTKPGISNTNLAGATVSGATDNFVVKVTEDPIATDAVIAALQARYGDISRIQYLPMDISLYDSTGRIKIADTTGISVNLTLPLPDELIQYAGNNRVAAVSNGMLEDLNTRFTTVGGVPCVNFTATHFSPYVIYVDTANLTEASIDATPKTGDPIHPKWFLAIGLACTSLILFFKRDKVVLNTKNA